jgi:D-alanyl-D-alanine carboxypeptidase (penicillin-binding protein 5/6)
MNKKAKTLGMNDTSFINTSGIHNQNHYTTAYDMYLLTNYATQNKDFNDITSSMFKTISPTNKTGVERKFYTDNHLISKYKNGNYYYKEARGVAVGYTEEAGYCLASTAQLAKNSVRLVGVVMKGVRAGKNDPLPTFVDMKKLFEEGFESFQIMPVVKKEEIIDEVPVILGSGKDFVTVAPRDTIVAAVPAGITEADIERKITLTKEIQAPVAKGQVLGSVTLSHDGKEYGKTDLVAIFDVERSTFLYVLFTIQSFMTGIWPKIILLCLVLFIILSVVLLLRANRKRKNRYRSKIRR